MAHLSARGHPPDRAVQAPNRTISARAAVRQQCVGRLKGVDTTIDVRRCLDAPTATDRRPCANPYCRLDAAGLTKRLDREGEASLRLIHGKRRRSGPGQTCQAPLTVSARFLHRVIGIACAELAATIKTRGLVAPNAILQRIQSHWDRPLRRPLSCVRPNRSHRGCGVIDQSVFSMRDLRFHLDRRQAGDARHTETPS